MTWNGDAIVDVGQPRFWHPTARRKAKTSTSKRVAAIPRMEGRHPRGTHAWPGDRPQRLLQQGPFQSLDSTIGAATVLMPFGGKNQLAAMAMRTKLPVDGETTTCSGMAWGFNPYLSSADRFEGSYVAVVESVAKLLPASSAKTPT